LPARGGRGQVRVVAGEHVLLVLVVGGGQQLGLRQVVVLLLARLGDAVHERGLGAAGGQAVLLGECPQLGQGHAGQIRGHCWSFLRRSARWRRPRTKARESASTVSARRSSSAGSVMSLSTRRLMPVRWPTCPEVNPQIGAWSS